MESDRSAAAGAADSAAALADSAAAVVVAAVVAASEGSAAAAAVAAALREAGKVIAVIAEFRLLFADLRSRFSISLQQSAFSNFRTHGKRAICTNDIGWRSTSSSS